jgi:triphosphoribosyl-dephospho-CoA synthase
VLAGLTREDAALAYRAIRLAAPGGLGRSDRHDVVDEPTVTLLEAMRTATRHDRIARQYAADFADVLEVGVSRLRACRAIGWSDPWATSATYLTFLARFLDSHVARKHGHATARAVRGRAAELSERLLVTKDPASLQPALLAFDRELKAAEINPGTSADLTVASHFAAALLAAQRSSKNTIT